MQLGEDMGTRKFLLFYFSLNLLRTECGRSANLYALVDSNAARDDAVLGTWTSQGMNQCALMCLAHHQCRTFSYLHSKCSMSEKLIDRRKLFSKLPSPGEHLYTVSCDPRRIGTCSEITVVGADYASCSGVYSVSTQYRTMDRLVYIKGNDFRFLYYNGNRWIIGSRMHYSGTFVTASSGSGCEPTDTDTPPRMFTCTATWP